MPKNKGLGGKHRRKGKGANDGPKEMIFSQEGEEYAQITKIVGSGYMEVLCFTPNGNVTKRAHIRGTMRKRVWMAVGDIVLVSVRDFQNSSCDIEKKYTSDEARILRMKKLIPDDIDINNNDKAADDSPFTFDKDIDDEDDSIEDKFGKREVSKQSRNLDLPPSEESDEQGQEEEEEIDLNKL